MHAYLSIHVLSELHDSLVNLRIYSPNTVVLVTLRIHTSQRCHDLLSKQRDSLANSRSIYSSNTTVRIYSTRSYLPNYVLPPVSSSVSPALVLFDIALSPSLLEAQRHKEPARIATSQLPPLPTGKCCNRRATTGL